MRPRCLVAAASALLAVLIGSATFPQDASSVGPSVQTIPMNQISAYSAQPGVVVIGSLTAPGHGHVVAVVPGTNRIWDGNILGGFVDLQNGTPVDNPNVVAAMNRVVNGGTTGPLTVQTMTPDQIAQYATQYAQTGAPISYSYRSSAQSSIVWYQVPTTQNISQVVQNYQPPPPTITDPTSGAAVNVQGLRCNNFVQQVAPVVTQRLVFDDSAPKNANTTPVNLTANQIDQALFSMTNRGSSASTPLVQPPPSPPLVPIFSPTPTQMSVIPKPGGVFITATADVSGLPPEAISSAAFDPGGGVLTLSLRSGKGVTCRLDPDNFAVAVKCVFQDGVDPALSMEYGKKPGYNDVHYCGPLFKTAFGETLYRVDRLLGELIFNREGTSRSTAADLIPGYSELACESHATMAFGSRVFLRASGARFHIQDDRLLCDGIDTKVDVEGLRYSAAYYQESLHRLARLLNAKMSLLREAFDEFQEFDKLAQCVALAKWIKAVGIPFDWSPIANRSVAVKDFPAHAPNSAWHACFNGVNLDGWRTDAPSGAFESGRKHSSVFIRPNGPTAVSVLAETWYSSYDLKYAVITKGPVDFIIRDGGPGSGATVSLDTKGKALSIELYLVDGKWTAIAPGLGKTGTLTLPKPAKPEDRKPNVYGFRVPAGSELALYTASFRGRE